MIFAVLKLAIWLAGVGVIGYYALPYFGYQINLAYFQERKTHCQEQIAECRNNLIKSGVEGARENCDITCVDPKILIEKK